MADENKTMIQRGISTVAEVETAVNEKAREEYVDAQDAATIEAAKAYTDTQIATRETPDGAQAKADAAAQAAQEAAITTATAHSDTALKAHTDNAAIHKTSEQIRAEIVDADIPDTLARVTAVDTKDAATLTTAKAYADGAVAALVGGAPETLDTLKEVAEALKANEDGAAAMMEVIGTKADAEATRTALETKVDKVETAWLMTDAEREKLEGVETGATAYTLPVASADTLGGVKAGNNVTIAEDGTLSATSGGGGAMYTIDFALSEIDQQKACLDGLLAAHAADPNVQVRIDAAPFLLTPINVNITGENVIIIANLLPPTEMSPRKTILSVLIVATRNEAGEIATIELWESREDNLGGDIPVASSIVLGGIKVGNNLSMREDGTLDAEAGGGTVSISPDAGNSIEERENGLYVPAGSGGGEVSDGRIRVSGVFDADGNIVSGEGFTATKIEGGPIFILKFPAIRERPYVVTANSLMKNTEAGGIAGLGMVIVIAHMGLDAVSGEPIYDAESCMLMYQPLGEGDNGGRFTFEAVTVFADPDTPVTVSAVPQKIHIGGVVNADGTIASGEGFTAEKNGYMYGISHPFGSEPFTARVTPILDPVNPTPVMPIVVQGGFNENTIVVIMQPISGDDGSCKFAFEAESLNTVPSGSAGVSPADFEALKTKVTGIETNVSDIETNVTSIEAQIGAIGTTLDNINGEEA